MPAPASKHPVVHFEIGCRDKSKIKAFYASLFGWKIDEQGPAAMIDTGTLGDGKGGGGAVGIGGHITSLGHEPHNYVTIYVNVEDLPAYIKKAESLGGKAIVPPQEVPGMGHFAWVADPEGTIVGLWKPMSQ